MIAEMARTAELTVATRSTKHLEPLGASRCILRCMRRTNVYLDEAQTAVLDEIAHEQGISRAELVRRLLHRGIANTPVDQEADLAAIEDSFGVLADESHAGRGPDQREAHLDRMRHS